ncbi:MAG: DUF3467 domain-containing protein [Planctomycetia bacterium]|nr:DUF3467 domain-containing protein [Planctomycetia bacterium]
MAAETIDKPSSPPATRAARSAVAVDDKGVTPIYANFCRVTGTPEELILDFGLNAQPFNPTQEPVVIAERLVLNFFTAKRMLHALQLTIQRHEAAFGVLETDVQKRVIPGARVPAAPQT